MHKIGDSAYLSFEGWDYRRMYVLLVYTLGGKLYWQYGMNTSDFVVPKGAKVYIEAVDGAGNAFIGAVDVRGDVKIRPNTRVPFIATLRIKYRDKVAPDVVRSFAGFAWMIEGAYVNVVDDYTVEVNIIKTEPGLKPLVAVIIVAGIVGSFAIWATVRISEIELEHRRLDEVRHLRERLEKMIDVYLSMINACDPGDLDCVARVNSLMLLQIQMLSSIIELLMSRRLMPTKCDGLNIGGVCVPWWVVGVAVFLAGLLVIAAVK
jgi:hypothetical protein